MPLKKSTSQRKDHKRSRPSSSYQSSAYVVPLRQQIADRTTFPHQKTRVLPQCLIAEAEQSSCPICEQRFMNAGSGG